MHLLRRLVRNRRGNFGMMTAILAIPVVGTAGISGERVALASATTRILPLATKGCAGSRSIIAK